MAISKILHMKDSGNSFHARHLKRALDYVMNPEKTQGGRLLSLMSQVKVCKHPFLLTHYTTSRMEWSLHLATGLMADCLVNR